MSVVLAALAGVAVGVMCKDMIVGLVAQAHDKVVAVVKSLHK